MTEPQRPRRHWTRFFLPVDDRGDRCRVETPCGRSFRVRVTDVSLRGIGLEIVERPSAEGEPLSGRIRFVECDVRRWGRYLHGTCAVVVWSEGDRAGCLLDAPLGASPYPF